MSERVGPKKCLLEDHARIHALMDLMQARGVLSFRVRSGEDELEVRWPEATGEKLPQAQLDVEHEEASALHAITSPTVGTYFASPEPGKPAFVKVGDRVEVGQVVCVVESMKLMNEIESDAEGVVLELPVQSGGSVKAGEVVCLLRLDPGR